MVADFLKLSPGGDRALNARSLKGKTVTTFGDLKPFFNLMHKEMQRHDPEQGDSWKNEEFTYYVGRSMEDLLPLTVKMDNYLDNRILEATEEYKKKKDVTQLEDIALLCAMRRLRTLPNFGREASA